MTEISIPIFIDCRGGRRSIEAWARNKDAPIACHLNDGCGPTWVITHIKSGKQINPSTTDSKDDAMALLDVYAPLADWNSVGEHDVDTLRKVRDLVVNAYERFWCDQSAAARAND